MCRLSWYAEWIDHFECGVRYRTVIAGRPVLAPPLLAEHAGMSSGGRKIGICSPSSAIQSWSR